MEIRSFHWVKIILWQSGPIYSFFTSSMLIPRPPPSSHAGRLAALDPAKASQGAGSLHLPLPSHPTQSWLPVIVLAQDVSPLQRELSRHTSEGAPQGLSSMSLFSFSVYVTLTTFCYFLVYCLLLLPESKLSKSEDPSVTVSPASKPTPDTFKNKLLDEWKKLTVTLSPLYSSEIEACEGYGISPQSQSKIAAHQDSNWANLLPRSAFYTALMPCSLPLCFLPFTPPGLGPSPPLPPTPARDAFSLHGLHA